MVGGSQLLISNPTGGTNRIARYMIRRWTSQTKQLMASKFPRIQRVSMQTGPDVGACGREFPSELLKVYSRSPAPSTRGWPRYGLTFSASTGRSPRQLPGYERTLPALYAGRLSGDRSVPRRATLQSLLESPTVADMGWHLRSAHETTYRARHSACSMNWRTNWTSRPLRLHRGGSSDHPCSPEPEG